MSESTTHGWLKMFPALSAISDDVWHRIMRSAQHVALPAGSAVFRGGQACENYLLVLEGMVKVQRVSEYGHEIILYRIGAGQVCELTTSCLLADAEYPAEAVAETAVRATLIPKAYFHEQIAEDAHVGIEDPLPDKTRNDERHGPREHGQCAEEGRVPLYLGESQPHGHTARKGQRGDSHRVNRRLPEGQPEDTIVEDIDVVLQSIEYNWFGTGVLQQARGEEGDDREDNEHYHYEHTGYAQDKSVLTVG